MLELTKTDIRSFQFLTYPYGRLKAHGKIYTLEPKKKPTQAGEEYETFEIALGVATDKAQLANLVKEIGPENRPSEWLLTVTRLRWIVDCYGATAQTLLSVHSNDRDELLKLPRLRSKQRDHLIGLVILAESEGKLKPSHALYNYTVNENLHIGSRQILGNDHAIEMKNISVKGHVHDRKQCLAEGSDSVRLKKGGSTTYIDSLPVEYYQQSDQPIKSQFPEHTAKNQRHIYEVG